MATFPRPLCELRALLTDVRPVWPNEVRRKRQVAERFTRLRAEPEGVHFPAMLSRLRVRRGVLARLLAEARSEPAVECCGFLAGAGGIVTEILPARNLLASATAYEIAPEELFELFRQMRERGLDHLGIYHSHPATDNSPSPTDIERAYYPGVAYFILSPRPDTSRPVRAFSIAKGNVAELEVETV